MHINCANTNSKPVGNLLALQAFGHAGQYLALTFAQIDGGCLAQALQSLHALLSDALCFGERDGEFSTMEWLSQKLHRTATKGGDCVIYISGTRNYDDWYLWSFPRNFDENIKSTNTVDQNIEQQHARPKRFETFKQGGRFVEAGDVILVASGHPQKRTAHGEIIIVACCRFGGHRDKVFSPNGEHQCNEGSSPASSSLRR